MTNLTHILIVLVIFFVLGLHISDIISMYFRALSELLIRWNWRSRKRSVKNKKKKEVTENSENSIFSEHFNFKIVSDSGFMIVECLKIIFNNFQTLWISRYLLTIFQSYKQIPKPHRPLKGHCTKNRSVKGQTWWTRCISWKIKREIWR